MLNFQQIKHRVLDISKKSDIRPPCFTLDLAFQVEWNPTLQPLCYNDHLIIMATIFWESTKHGPLVHGRGPSKYGLMDPLFLLALKLLK